MHTLITTTTKTNMNAYVLFFLFKLASLFKASFIFETRSSTYSFLPCLDLEMER